MSKSQIIGVIIYLIVSAFSLARADEPKQVIVDNDFTGPPDTLDDLRSALMFLDNANVKVLGFTVVTGNGWRNEEVAHLLRLEEIASRCDVPVIPGAVTPLLNTLQTTREWEGHYSHRYMGAWDTKDQRHWESNYSPHERDFVPQIPEELPKLQPARETAVEFLIKQVHAYPHKISIFAGGPLTNIALAVRADPEFVGLVKELLFFGGARTLTQPDFNFRFDPEAAQIVVGANWPNIISVCDVTYGKSIKLEQSDLAKIGAGNTPSGVYVVNFSHDDVGTNNLWDEICAAILIDRSLITESQDAYIDVVVDPQKVDYGAVKVSCRNALIDGQSKVRIVTAFDYGRFKALFVDSMIGPKPKAFSN
jgi:purine nucleosidase